MQLKAFIKKKAEEKNISAQLVMQNYMMERLLERISLSKYKRNFILKGGFLISAIVGLDTRTTMDLDTTVKGITLTKESMQRIMTEICSVEVEDDVHFILLGVSDIREGETYPEIKASNRSPCHRFSDNHAGIAGVIIPSTTIFTPSRSNTR